MTITDTALRAPDADVTAGNPSLDTLDALAPAFRAAADVYGTPLYVTDLQTLDHCAAEAESAFPEPWRRQYSLKANALPALVRRLGSLGWGGNIVSAGEWRLARRAGLPNAAISFEGIGKTDQELEMVVRAALDGQPLQWLSVESADELQALSRLWQELTAGRRGLPSVGVLVRLNPQVEPETIAGLAVGRPSSKLGQEAAHRGGAAVQVNRAEEQLLPRQLHAVGDADVADVATGPGRPDGLQHRFLGADGLDHRVCAQPAGELLNRGHAFVAPFGDDFGGAELQRQLLAGFVPAHRDDPLGAQLPGGQHGEQADCAVTDHRDGLAGLHVGGDGAEPAGAEHVRGGQQAGKQIIGGHLGSGDQGAVG
jgi:hypothetical protein